MKSALLAAAVLAFTAGAAWAQQAKGADPAYDQELQSRPLAPADSAYCSEKAAGDRLACKVTRNYLADIAQKREKGFPPNADIRFARTAKEQGDLMDRVGG